MASSPDAAGEWGAALPAAYYDRPVVEVARDLVGCVLTCDGAAGRVVETEAYHHTEPACHAYVGLTARTSVLFREPGTAYVYRSYGIHALLNAVCEGYEVGAAVLIRAVEPLAEVELMRLRRHVARDEDLTNGPGKLTQALGIELEDNASSLVDGRVRLHAPPPGRERPELLEGTRIGITKAVELPWRFCAADSRHVSRPWPAGLRERVGRRRSG